MPFHFDEGFQLFINSRDCHQLSRSCLSECLHEVLVEGLCWCKRDEYRPLVAEETGQVEHLSCDVAQGKEAHLADVVLQVLHECDGWTLVFALHLRLLELKPVLDLPEPAHVVVREHDTFGISSGATCVEEIAAHSRRLLDHPLDHDPVVDVLPKLQELGPVVHLDLALAFLLILRMLAPSISPELIPELSEDHSYLDPERNQLVLIREVLLFQSMPRVANEHL